MYLVIVHVQSTCNNINGIYAYFLMLPGCIVILTFVNNMYCYPSENACWSSYSGHITDITKNKLEKKQLLILSKLITHLK